jgi:arylsulfatase A-like enzyme
LLPTFSKLASANLPNDRVYDGYDISPVLFGTGKDPRNVVYYYRDTQVFAIRMGDYKAHLITQPEYGSESTTVHETPLLYNLNVDPSEKYDIADKHPEVIAEMKKILEKHQAGIVQVENQLEKY